MPGISDFSYQEPEPWSPGPGGNRRKLSPRVIVAGLVIAAAAGYYFFGRTPAAPPPNRTAAPTTAPAPPPTIVAEQLPLPKLQESDPFVREEFAKLTADPLMAAWLKTNGLVRSLVVILENTARGLTPSKHLRMLAPPGKFKVMKMGTRVYIDPTNYDRFNALAAAATSINPAAAAKLYNGMKPLLQVAYDELGNQEPIDRALERALSTVAGAPVVDTDIRVELDDAGIGYRYEDPSLENLSGAQKQMIRMGPKNERAIQNQLRQFGLAAGISTAGAVTSLTSPPALTPTSSLAPSTPSTPTAPPATPRR